MGRVLNEKTVQAKVYRVLSDCSWYTAKELSEALKGHEIAGITAAIRRLRQDGCRIDVRRRSENGYSYRLVDENTLKTKAEEEFRTIIGEAGPAPSAQALMMTALKFISEGRSLNPAILSKMVLQKANGLRLLRLQKLRKNNGASKSK